MSRLDTIRQKLDELRKSDRELVVFGAKRHKHRLNPPLPEQSLRDFAHEFGVPLPNDFAAFLTELGDGGAGPYYGLYPFQKFVTVVRRGQQFYRDRNLRTFTLSKQFPFTSADAQALIEQTRRNPTRPAASVAPKEGEATEEGEVDGVIEICEYGCGGLFYLVLTGQQRGNVWFSDTITWAPPANDLNRTDFLSWYESELDRWLAPGAITKWASLFDRE